MSHSYTRTHVAHLVLIVGIISLFCVALPHTSHATETETETTATPARKAKVDATCMATAVEVRETAILGAWEEYTTSVTEALTTRKTALLSAWALTDVKAQRTALVSAWKTWKKASVDAHKELKKDRKATWDAFKKTAKDTCKISTPKEEALGKDAAGSIAL